MNVLNEVADALRRAAGGGMFPSRIAPDQVPGTSTSLARVGAPGLPWSRQTADDAQGVLAVDDSHDAKTDRGRAPAMERTALPGAVHPARTMMMQPGRSEARWENPLIDASMPMLLRIHRLRSSKEWMNQTLRSQLSLEVRLFRDRVGNQAIAPHVVANASYLLCTYIDEVVSDAARELGASPYNGEPSLLIEFHGDALGGEDAFAELEQWMEWMPAERTVLEFYELILAFGWEGRYRVMERGSVLLDDLRSRLHVLIWHERKARELASLSTAVVTPLRKRWLTESRAVAMGLLGTLLLYVIGIIDLDTKGRPIREAIAAWEPPRRTINLAETLPPPLPQLLSEGWLSARKVPQGWLLSFKSDRVFDAGQADFRPEFRRQLDRLGAAFARWPGDMEVRGHSDAQPIRTMKFPNNLALSQERARVVAEELMQTTVAGGGRAPLNAMSREILSAGRGDMEPVDPARTPDAYERNRRVEILWKVAHLEPQYPRGGER